MENNELKIEGITELQKLCIPIISGFKVIDIEQIIYLEAHSNYTTIFLTNDTRFISTKSLGEFENKLLGKGFFRCHRTYLISLDFVDEFNSGQNASIILSNHKKLPLARNRKQAFLRFFPHKL